MGGGPMHNWEESWDLLPLACEQTWSEMEYISAQIVQDFDILKKSIENIEPPQPQWKDLRERSAAASVSEKMSSSPILRCDDGDLELQVRLLTDKTNGVVSLNQIPFHDQFSVVGCLHALLKRHIPVAPNAVFVGGTLDKSFLVLFQRPLLTEDFVTLWSIPTGENRGEGAFTSP
jgi:type VI secretion system protein VasJ